MTDVHPSSTQLNDFLLGKLADADHAVIEVHLATCARCVAAASGLSSLDTLAELLTAANTRLERERSLAPPHTTAGSDQTGAFEDRPALHGDEDVIPAGLADHPRYLLVRPLGAGGMGSVWLARHLLLDRAVAIKVIRPELLAAPGAVERFRRESRAVAKLSHPNIVAALDAEESVGTHFLVMEYVAGDSLANLLTHGPLSPDAACRAVGDAALGLAHAHAAGLAHRDIKPSNLIRTPEGLTKILDFGLATAELGSQEGLTGQNMVVGTPDYIAPEQAEDAHAADARSDVYSLGCTLFHLLTGQVPFPGPSVLKKLDAHRHAARPLPANVPAPLANLVARMMATQPSKRPTASAVVRELEPFRAGDSRPPRRQRWLGAGLVLALVLVVGSALFVLLHNKVGSPPLPPVETPPDRAALLAVTAFRSLHGGDLKALRQWVADLPEGYRPFQLAARGNSAPPRFDAVACRDGRAVPVKPVFELDRGEINHMIDYNASSGSGWSLRLICTYREARELRRHHIWMKDGKCAVWGANLDYVPERLSQCKKDGLRPGLFYLNALDPGRGADTRPYGISFQSDLGLDWEARTELTADELQQTMAEARQRGQRPEALSAIGEGRDRTYSLSLVPNPTALAWDFRADLTLAEFESAVREQRQADLRPMTILSEGVGDAVRYLCLWVEYAPEK